MESSYDIEAHNATKREKNWTGYPVNLTETCDEDYPRPTTFTVLKAQYLGPTFSDGSRIWVEG